MGTVDKSLQKKCFFAMSSLARGMGMSFFKDYDGFSLLKTLYDQQIPLRSNIIVLMSDLIDPNMSQNYATKDLKLADFDFWCEVLYPEKIKYLESLFTQKCS